jgi:hypothetical protein
MEQKANCYAIISSHSLAATSALFFRSSSVFFHYFLSYPLLQAFFILFSFLPCLLSFLHLFLLIFSIFFLHLRGFPSLRFSVLFLHYVFLIFSFLHFVSSQSSLTTPICARAHTHTHTHTHTHDNLVGLKTDGRTDANAALLS